MLQRTVASEKPNRPPLGSCSLHSSLHICGVEIKIAISISPFSRRDFRHTLASISIGHLETRVGVFPRVVLLPCPLNFFNTVDDIVLLFTFHLCRNNGVQSIFVV